MSIRLLETFGCLARLKNLSKTADMLDITQPAISTRMSRIEEIVGAELYHHHTSEFALTSQGRKTLKYAKRILDVWSELNQNIQSINHEIEEFRVGIIEIAFVVGPVNGDMIHSAQICSFSLAWHGSAHYFSCDQAIDVPELSGMPIITYGPNS